MEITLKGNQDQVHRFAFDDMDYELIFSSQSSTDEFAEVYKKEIPDTLTIMGTPEFCEYIVLIESDRLLNYEAYTSTRVLDELGSFVPFGGNIDISGYFPVGESAHYGSVYYGRPYYDDVLSGVDDTYDVYGSAVGSVYSFDGTGLTPETYASQMDKLINFSETGINKILLREAKVATFACFKMYGQEISLLIGEHDAIPANYSAKIYKKVLFEEEIYEK